MASVQIPGAVDYGAIENIGASIAKREEDRLAKKRGMAEEARKVEAHARAGEQHASQLEAAELAHAQKLEEIVEGWGDDAVANTGSIDEANSFLGSKYDQYAEQYGLPPRQGGMSPEDYLRRKNRIKRSNAPKLSGEQLGDFTLESVSDYQVSGDVGDLVRRDSPDKKTAAEVELQMIGEALDGEGRFEGWSAVERISYLESKGVTADSIKDPRVVKEKLKEANRLKRRNLEIRRGIQTIDKAMALIEEDPTTTGWLGTAAKYVPGSKGMALAGDIQSISASLGFDSLQKMREESPTGGALGQVAVPELEALQRRIRTLNQSMSAEDLAENLGFIRESMEIIAAINDLEAQVVKGEITMEEATAELDKYMANNTDRLSVNENKAPLGSQQDPYGNVFSSDDYNALPAGSFYTFPQEDGSIGIAQKGRGKEQ